MKKESTFLYGQFLQVLFWSAYAGIIFFLSVGIFSILPPTNNIAMIGYAAALANLLVISSVALVYEIIEVHKQL